MRGFKINIAIAKVIIQDFINKNENSLQLVTDNWQWNCEEIQSLAMDMNIEEVYECVQFVIEKGMAKHMLSMKGE